MEQHRFAAGQYIFGEGDPSEFAYIIDSGSVEIVKAVSTGEVLLAVLRAGDIFGEMGLIDEAPRSAAARAAEPVVASAVQRHEFVQLILSRNERGLSLLRALFERLRTTNQLLLAEREMRDLLSSRRDARQVRLVPATPEACRTLSNRGIEVTRFPFRVGRKAGGIGGSVLACNEVELDDSPPYQVSLNHMAIDLDRDAIIVRDRGSQHGTGVNGIRLGGDALRIVAPLIEGDNDIVLGRPESRWRLSAVLSAG